ncbi:hypothetical protein PAMP_000249 [Pampus punctatissimus]
MAESSRPLLSGWQTEERFVRADVSTEIQPEFPLCQHYEEASLCGLVCGPLRLREAQEQCVVTARMESPVSTPAPPPLHLLATVGNSEIASPCEQIMVRTRSVAVNTSDVALATEPECLGPCEPGTSVNLEGIVWQETEDE